MTSICPYCGSPQPKEITRKKKCVTCKQPICLKSWPNDRVKRLMKEEEALAAEAAWEEEGRIGYAISRAKDYMRTLDIPFRKLEAEAAALGGDIEQALWNKLLDVSMVETDPYLQKNVFLWLSSEARRKGLNHLPYLAESHRWEVAEAAAKGYRDVSISVKKDACPVCRRDAGRLIDIRTAHSQSILPHPGCSCLGGNCTCWFRGENNSRW